MQKYIIIKGESMISKNYKMWKSIPDGKRCFSCRILQGKVYSFSGPFVPNPPRHLFCRCFIGAMEAEHAGSATILGTDGADWWLKYMKRLPSYYITAKEAEEKGYHRKSGNLNLVAPGKMYTRGVYHNRDGRLPEASGRTWYEADIDYVEGFRNKSRILFSNDGLVFVTYDHYDTFVEIL